jgi:hypothetical protein
VIAIAELRPGAMGPGVVFTLLGRDYSLDLERVVCAAMVEIMTEAGDK